MTFYPKRDKSFSLTISFAIFLLSCVFAIPLFSTNQITILGIILLIVFFAVISTIILLNSFYIRYHFKEDALVIRGGIFKFKIAYSNIKKIDTTKDISTGFKILSSDEALEIYYTDGFSGSVKISPRSEKVFIDQLKHHCPKLQILKTHWEK